MSEHPHTRPAAAANSLQNKPSSRFKHYLVEHRNTASTSLEQLWRRPFSSLMTIMVIGLSLALPLILTVLLENGQTLLGGWHNQSQISLFLRLETSDSDAEQLAQNLKARKDIKTVRAISKQQSLQDYETLTQSQVATDLLEGNPLPAVIIVEAKSNDAAVLEKLHQELQALPAVEFVQVDLQWIKRLQAMLEIGQYLAQTLTVMLALVLLFVVMNTLKLLIENRRAEIEITLLVGGSPTYIRRPFLYLGFWYGLLGALLAISAVEVLVAGLQVPVTSLANLYQSQFSLHSMSLPLFFEVLALSCMLGMVGAWLEVSLHLYRARPR